jgi:hypothetical protein
MEIEPMYTVRKHSIVLTPGALDSVLGYTNYFLKDIHAKLEEYHTERAKLHGQGVRPIREDDALSYDVRRVIAQAEQVAQDVELLRDEVACIYRWHFEQLAQVWRVTRRELGLTRIEEVPELKRALGNTMKMLKSENPKFSEDKFIKYINN